MKRFLEIVISSLFFSIGFAVVFSINASAYIDPSVMTYAIQAIAGIAIAIGAAVGIYFRKIKKNVWDKLGVDENRNKEVEDDNIMITKKNEK